MPDGRTGLIEAARQLLVIAANETPREDITGAELQALYGVISTTSRILSGYTVTATVPELRGGAQGAAAELQRAMWILEDAWLQRYARHPLAQNVISMPLRRTA